MREQITITREEFQKKIVENPRRYGVARMLRENPEKAEGHELMAIMEELTTAIVLHEIETELFGDEEEAEPEVQDLPFC